MYMVLVITIQEPLSFPRIAKVATYPILVKMYEAVWIYIEAKNVYNNKLYFVLIQD